MRHPASVGDGTWNHRIGLSCPADVGSADVEKGLTMRIALLAMLAACGFAAGIDAASAEDGGCVDQWGRPVHIGHNVVCTPRGVRRVGPPHRAYGYHPQYQPYYAPQYAPPPPPGYRYYRERW